MMTKIPYLKLPDKYESITVKVVKSPYMLGEKEKKVYCDVRLWGDVKMDRIFRMEIGKTLWRSLYEELKFRYEMGGDYDDEIDPRLECLLGRVITIRGIVNVDMVFNKIGSTGNREDSDRLKLGTVTVADLSAYGKKFEVSIREDLEEIEKIGGEQYIKKAQEELTICALRNLEIIDENKKKKLEVAEKKKKREKVGKKLKDFAGW